MNAIEKIQQIDNMIRDLKSQSTNHSPKPMARLRASMAGKEIRILREARHALTKSLPGSVKRGISRGKVALAA